MKKSIIVLVFLILITRSYSQLSYTGEYKYYDQNGIATYTYINKNGDKVKNVAFAFKSKIGLKGNCSTIGSYENDFKTGLWTSISNWSVYNDEEYAKSDLNFFRIDASRPFIEISKKQTSNWLKGILNGKEQILYTKKESWGMSGGGSKVTLYKKEKSWRNGKLSDFSFEIYQNNILKDFIKGKYKYQNNILLYDGEWSGRNAGYSFKFTYKNGELISKIIKNESTNQIINNDVFSSDDLAEKFTDTSGITVEYENNPSKLFIKSFDNYKYEFMIVSSQVDYKEPDQGFKNLISYIEYSEKSGPYDNNYGDNDWIAGTLKFNKLYINSDRLKGDFRKINAIGNEIGRAHV